MWLVASVIITIAYVVFVVAVFAIVIGKALAQIKGWLR